MDNRSNSRNVEIDMPRMTQSAGILLRRVFRILRGCGISETQLREMAAKTLNEIERISDAQAGRVTARQAVLCSDVVLKWRRDCQFLDADGIPALLPMTGIDASFESLVHAGAPGVDPKVVLATMAELGVVRILSDKKIELISESVVACSGREGSAIASECVLEHICGFLGSVEFNVFDKPSRAKGRFERACYASVPKELVPVLQRLVSTRGQDFVDAIDEWLARRSCRTEDSAETLLVGAGAYLFVREKLP
jgi:hypothetical protein